MKLLSSSISSWYKFAITHNCIVFSIAIEKGIAAIVIAVQWEIRPFALTGRNRILLHLYQRKQRYAQKYQRLRVKPGIFSISSILIKILYKTLKSSLFCMETNIFCFLKIKFYITKTFMMHKILFLEYKTIITIFFEIIR